MATDTAFQVDGIKPEIGARVGVEARVEPQVPGYRQQCRRYSDMDPLEGLELLVYLRDWAMQERFSYSHEWTVGDTVIWDDTGTLHRAMPCPLDSSRMMHRTKLQGEEAIV